MRRTWLVNIELVDWMKVNWHDRMELFHDDTVDVQVDDKSTWVAISGDHRMPYLVQQLVSA